MNNIHQNPLQDKPSNRNLILAVFLSATIMGLWHYFYEAPRLRAHQEAVKAEQIKQQEKLKAHPELAEQVAKSVIGTPIGAAKPREEVIKNSPRLKISNSKLHGSIRLVGARLDDITLAKYREELDKKSPEVVLLSPTGTKEANMIDIGWIAGDASIKAPDSDSLWQVEGNDKLTPETPVTLKWDNGQGFTFRTKFNLDKDYMFQIEQTITNTGTSSATFFPYGLISKTERANEKELAMMLHTGPMGVMDGTLKEVSYGTLREEKSQSFDNSTGWVGVTDKYWFKSLIPDENEKYKANFRYNIDGQVEKFQIDYLGQAKAVPAGATVSYNAKIFAGAKELHLLEKYRDEYNLKLFDRAIDFGWFYFLSKPMMKLLQFFYNHIANFGICILLLTLCVKLCLFPLARKSYIAMGKLKVLGPKIKELQTRYKDDKMQLNREMMELYKKEKANPASGCLPILLQLPVFIALYKVFLVSIEMRHTPFFGWIQDLSIKDPTSIFNLFGLLPYDVPSFMMIGAWPMLWVVTMIIQQKISPAPTDPTQAKVMKIMPWMMLFLFAPMPAGLVIYWTFSNIFTIGQQLYFLKHLPKH